LTLLSLSLEGEGQGEGENKSKSLIITSFDKLRMSGGIKSLLVSLYERERHFLWMVRGV
jgi:hypothetical protein